MVKLACVSTAFAFWNVTAPGPLTTPQVAVGRAEQIHDVLTRAVGLTARAQSDLGGWLYTPDARADEGSVTVIDLAANKVVREIQAGLHSSAMALSPDRRHLLVANAASDNISVIDTRTDKIVETIWAKPSPADLFGASLYIKTKPQCPAGGTYSVTTVAASPTCSVGGTHVLP